MRNTWILIKNYFNCFLHNIFSKKNEKFKYGSAVLFLLLFGGIFIFMFTSLAIDTTTEAIKFGEPIIALYLNASMSLLFVILMTITKSTTSTKSNDDELLLSLPVTKTNIVSAKVFYDYLFDFVIVLITLLPSYVVYLYLVPDASFLMLLRGFIVIITLPMLSSAFGYFIGLFFSFLSRHFKHYSIIQSIITIVILVLFLGSYYGIAFISTSDSMNGANMIMNLEPVKWIVNFVNKSDLLSLLYILLCTLLPFIISVFVKARFLGVTLNKYKTKNKELKFKVSSPTMALFKKEASRYFNIPLYVINTLFGGILLIIVGVIISTLGTNYIDNLLISAGIGSIDKYYFVIILLLIEFSLSTICTTSSSISLEGKSLWILKAHPTSAKDIFKAKILFNVLIASIPSIICSILVSISLGLKYLPFLIVISIISSYIVSSNGLLMNLIYPKLVWDNESEPIKQSLSTGISMGVNLLLLLVPIIIYFLLQILLDEIIVLLIVTIIYILMAIVVSIILENKGSKLFEKLNN